MANDQAACAGGDVERELEEAVQRVLQSESRRKLVA